MIFEPEQEFKVPSIAVEKSTPKKNKADRMQTRSKARMRKDKHKTNNAAKSIESDFSDEIDLD